MKTRTFLCTFITSILLQQSAFASLGIGLFSTPDGSNCNLTLVPFQPAQLYVLYRGLGGPLVTGVEYRIAGMPGAFGVDYVASLIYAPGSNLQIGHAFDGTGHQVAFPAPQGFDAYGNLLVATYSLIVINPNLPLSGVILGVVKRNPPSNSSFHCPLIVDPLFYFFCRLGGELRLNGGPPCTIAVETKTWSEVRGLYR